MADLVDYLGYMNDSASPRASLHYVLLHLTELVYSSHPPVFLLGISPLSTLLSEHILRFLFLSLLVECLMDPLDGPPQEVRTTLRNNDGRHSTHTLPSQNRVPPLLCCYLLAQVFLTYTNPPLVNTLGTFLLHPNPRV